MPLMNGISEDEQKYNYYYNLLEFMRHPQQYNRIANDAYISAALISIWCIFNMCTGYPSPITSQGDESQWNSMVSASIIEQIYERQERFNHVLVFLIAVLVIHKDIILCNAQLCMPMLLLFNFTVRFSIQYVIKFELSWDAVNCAVILVLLWFVC